MSNIDSIEQQTGVKRSQPIERFPDGSRFAVRHSWKTGGGHVYVAEKQNGQVSFFDPQNPKIDAAAYLIDKDARKFGYMRIDDAEFNPNIPITEIVR